MATISAAIICKNESASIDKCLESLKGFDEICVIDTGSEDNTVEIVKKYTDKVFTDFKWNDNFSDARNYANSKCTGDWIFVIDADNRLVPPMKVVEGIGVEILDKDGKLLNPIEEIKKEIEKAEKKGLKTVDVGIFNEKNTRYSHHLPLLFKNCKESFWTGAIHNYFSIVEHNHSDLAIVCWWGEAHKKDPERTLRILKKECETKPQCVREKYYLGREYFLRENYINSIWWLEEYLKVATWGKEMADARLTASRCYWNLGKGDLARAHCLEAICLDANFKEALLFMAHLSGPKNRERWINFAYDANDSDVLFHRPKIEQEEEFYDSAFKESSDMSRYDEIQKEIGKLVGDSSALDVGCGTAQLSKYVKNYKGFDFSKEAVKIANNPNVWVGNAYDKENYKEADCYVSTETLEHTDDLKVIANIPSGKRFIFSVPSFDDTAHLRVYTEKIVRERFGGLLDIKNIVRFNWINNKWDKSPILTSSWILLCDSIRK